MKTKNEKDIDFEVKLMQKLLRTINEHFPKEEERAIPSFDKEIKRYKKDITDKNILFFTFIRWFLLKYKVGDYVTLIDFISTNPDMEFTALEMEAIKNIQDYKESLFELVEISKDKKNLILQDILKNGRFKIIMQKPFKNNVNKKIILATIAKRVKGEYYFFGPCFGYDEKDIPGIKKNFFGDEK